MWHLSQPSLQMWPSGLLQHMEIKASTNCKCCLFQGKPHNLTFSFIFKFLPLQILALIFLKKGRPGLWEGPCSHCSTETVIVGKPGCSGFHLRSIKVSKCNLWPYLSPFNECYEHQRHTTAQTELVIMFSSSSSLHSNLVPKSQSDLPGQIIHANQGQINRGISSQQHALTSSMQLHKHIHFN